MLFRGKKSYREVSGKVKKVYGGYDMGFWFFGSIQDVAKAKGKGVESTLLNNSIEIIKTYKACQDDCVVFDIGANFGFLSLVWAQSVSKNGGCVHAFEPNPTVFKSFQKSIVKNDLEVVIAANHAALGNENKIIDLYLSNTTSNVLESIHSGVKTQVDMFRLDSYVQNNSVNRCDLIKIDVDGIELDILKGAEETLKAFEPIFVVETNSDMRIVDFFKSHGYEVLDMNLQPFKDGDSLPVNVFCVPKQV
ncbi:hypothetical protein GCM10022395_21300 [Snuella lapsa]|uniref:Methyltransferase FkbM domain-containing protein n=2 Tax=Snuella lapsa TaxID=870481 RepID=A0ABP6XS53_9FLAO